MSGLIPILTSNVGRSSFAAVCALIGLIALARLRERVRETTMIRPWGWAVFSLLSVAGAEIVLAWTDADADACRLNRYFAASTTFAPAMAVFGAKRPQDFAWTFIVLSLLFILGVPAVQWSWFSRGQGLELHPAFAWFMSILLALAAFNYAGTRFWPSALLAMAGQVLLLNGWLPTPAFDDSQHVAQLIALALVALALALVALGWPRAKPAAEPLNAVWRDFHDLYGNVWAFRVLGRVDEAAAATGWGVSLGLAGFFTIQEPGLADAAIRQAVTANLSSHLQRFVSRDWIAARLKGQETSPENAAQNGRRSE